MVRVTMRKDGVIEMPDAAAPKVRGNHILAHIELRFTNHAFGSREAACVNEHGLAIRKDEKKAIALADIDGGEFKITSLD